MLMSLYKFMLIWTWSIVLVILKYNRQVAKAALCKERLYQLSLLNLEWERVESHDNGK